MFDETFLLAHLLPHDVRVLPVDEDWPGEPAKVKLELGVGGLNVIIIRRVLRLHPIDIEGDANST